jgi:hypothetical protein
MNKKDKIQEIPNRHVWLLADAYLESAKVLYENKSQSGKLIPVIISNVCFSIELYLKALNSNIINEYISENGKTIQNKEYVEVLKYGHALDRLFESLPEIYKEILKEQYLEEFENNIEDIFKKYSGLYVKVRYLFEKTFLIEKKSLPPLFKLADFMAKSLYNIKYS